MKRELHGFMIQYLSDSRLYKQFVEQYGSKEEVKSVLLHNYNSDDFFGETESMIALFDKYSVLDKSALDDFIKIQKCCKKYGVNVADIMQLVADLCYSGKLSSECCDMLIDKLALYIEKALCDGGIYDFDKRIACYAAAALKNDDNCSTDFDTNDKMTSLKGADKVRKKPSVYFSACGTDGINNAFMQMIYRLVGKSAQSLDIILRKNGEICIEYIGEIGFDEKSFFELYADFELSVLCAVQYACEYMNISFCKNGTKTVLCFEKGEKTEEYSEKCDSPDKATLSFKFDKEVFGACAVDFDYACGVIKDTAIVNDGLRCSLADENDGYAKTQFLYENGIKDYINEIVADDNHSAAEFFDCTAHGCEPNSSAEYTARLLIGVCFAEKTAANVCFHNNRRLEFGGTHTNAIIEEIYCKMSAKYPDLTKEKIMEHLVLVVKTDTAPECTRWQNGTRQSICNMLITDAARRIIKERFLPNF
ncbi:MAG: hypothetical protein ACI396_05780 [Acutalibacteraceae bacterium]